MLKPITTSSTNSIQQPQQILSEPSTPNSTTTQNTDQSSILSPTSPNQINIQNLQNVQLNQTSQQDYEFNDLLRQFNLIQMLNKQQSMTTNDLLMNNNNLNQPNFNQYLNNSNQTDELTNLLLNNIELNNNNPLAINNNIIGNTTSNNLQFTNDSLLGINQHLNQANSQYYQHQSNLNSNQHSNLSNLHQQTASNRIPLNCSPIQQQHQPINRIKPRSIHILCKFGKLGQSPGCLSSPHGFCLGVDEEIVIADTFNHRICIFEKTGQFKHQFGVPGKDDGQLWYPRKVGLINTRIDPPRYVVCDRGSERSRMQIFSKDGHFMHRISIKYVDIVAGLVVTSDGLIVVVDSVSATLFVIREDGKALHKIECKAYMTEPSDIAVFRNHFYICDFKGHCVVVFNSDGQFVRRIGNDKITNYPNGIDIANNGDIIIGDSHGNKFHIVVYSEDGKFLREFECSAAKVSRCCGLRITKEGYIVTLAKNNHHVLILDALFNLINGQNNQQINNNSIQNQSLQFLHNNNTSTTSSQLLNGHNSSKEDIDFENLDSVTQHNLMNLLALCDQPSTTTNQQTKELMNSLSNNNEYTQNNSNLINNNIDQTTALVQLLNGLNSSFAKNDSISSSTNSNNIQSTLDNSFLEQQIQELSFNENLLNNYSGNNLSKINIDRNDSAATISSDLTSSSVIGSSITTSPIPSQSDTSNLFLDSSLSPSQHQLNNNHSTSKTKNIMTIEHKFGHLGSGKGEFSSPHGFCIGHEDEIIIADTFNHRICVFTQAGQYLYEFGVAGKEEGELWHPRKVAVTKIQASASCHEQRQHLLDQTKFVVCDRGSEKSRMQIFSRNGQFIRKISITYIDIVAGLAITPTNNIVAVDSVQPTVFIIEEEGKLIKWFDTSAHMREPSDIAVNGDLLYICDFKGHQVVVFNDQGVFLRTIGNESITKFPNGIEVGNRGDIIVGDSHGNRFHVVVFNKNGNALKEFECPYVKVSRCCGLKLSENGNIVTLAKNNHHVLVLRGISIN